MGNIIKKASFSYGELTCFFTTAMAFAILMIAIYFSPKELLYDERAHFVTVLQLKESGLTSSFLRGMKYAPGPLHSIVHVLIGSCTSFKAPNIRWVNVFFLIGTSAVLFFLLRARGSRRPSIGALSIIAAPMIFVVSGLSLTEMPAIFFFYLGLLLLLISLDNNKTFQRKIVMAGLSGISLGISVIGRQPFLVVFVTILLLPIFFESSFKQILTCMTVGAILPALLFFIWKGVLPPEIIPEVSNGYSLHSLLLSYAYAGLLMFLFSPRWLFIRNGLGMKIFVTSFFTNLVTNHIKITPMFTLANAYLASWWIEAYSRTASSTLFSLALLFLFSLARRIKEERDDGVSVFLNLTTLVALAHPIFITAHFSTRYVTMEIPLLIVIGDKYSDCDYWKGLRMATGSILGMLILASYYGYLP